MVCCVKLIKIMNTYNKIKIDAEFMGVGLQWAIAARKRYLNGEIAFYTEAISDLIKSLAGKDSIVRELYLLWIGEHSKKREALQSEMAFLKPNNNSNNIGINDDLILRAKEYPIEKLLPNTIKSNKTNCFAHDDKTPSMGIKNNRVKCFSCGYSGSSIDVAMYLNNFEFKEAVKFINNLN